MTVAEAIHARKPEWEAELRFLRRQESAVKNRIEELEEILRTFFREGVR